MSLGQPSAGGSSSGIGHAHRPPADCPVCGSRLHLTRLSCGSCGTELSGGFASCAFCALTDAERELLRVFLVSRGNLREVERHLQVSYPTARQRYTDLLVKLGLESPAGSEVNGAGAPRSGRERDEILAQLARGDLDVDSASELLHDLD